MTSIRRDVSDVELLIKAPRYTGGDLMFLHRFVRRRTRRCRRHRRRPQIPVYAITLEQLFRFLSFLARLLVLTCRLPYYILGNFRHDLDLEGQIWNLLYLSRKWSDCYETNSKHIAWTLWIKCDYRIWPWLWPWPWISRSNMEFAITQPRMVRLPGIEKQTYQLNSRA